MLFLKAFFLLHILDMSQQTTICPFVQIDQFLLISNFNSYKELNFTNCPVANILSLEIRPNGKQILDSSLNLTGLKIKPTYSYFTVVLKNIKGIDIHTNFISQIKFLDFQSVYPIYLYFHETNFDFYRKTKLIDNNSCDLNLYNEITLNNNGFTKTAYYLYLKHMIKFSDKLCPLLFHFANFSVLDISTVKSNFLIKNTLVFMDLNYNYS